MHTRIKIRNLAAPATRLPARREIAPPPASRAHIQRFETVNDPNTEKDRLLGYAAHELRNPLSTICGLAEFLRDGAVGELSPHQRNLVHTIRDASVAALELVNQLLEVEGGPMRLNWDRHQVSRLVQECIALITLEAVRKDIHVVFESPLAVEVEADGPKIKQVITNLLTNAIKYSPPGSTITVSMEHDPRAGACRFAVRDQGPGIPEHERHMLFTLFGRLSVEPTGGEKSTGIGLALCRRIVEAHRGTIDAHNLPEGGCEFRVELPLVSSGCFETPPPASQAVTPMEKLVAPEESLAAA
jgi:two-component system, sensor histidine kinase and response regulator